MVEAFTSEHNVTFDEVLYEWPDSKFRALYSAFAKRKISDELSLQRSLEIAALWGNTNLDQEKNPKLRQNLMEEVDKRYSIAIAGLYGDHETESAADRVPESDPFWQAAKRGIEKRRLPEPKRE